MDFVQLYEEGGWLMRPILILGLFSAATGFLAVLRRMRITIVFAFVVGAASLGLGLWGYQLCMADLEMVLSSVVPEQFEMARAAGVEVAMIPLQFGAACAAPALFGGLLGLLFARKPASAVDREVIDLRLGGPR